MKTYDFPLSVILLTHNQSDILEIQITSLEYQKNIKASDFEVVITDDSSQPEEVSKIEQVLAKTSLSCRLLRQKSDRFWATRARNSAIDVAKGKLLIFLDGDMIPETDLLSKHLLLQKDRINHIVAGHRLRRRFKLHGNSFSQVLNLCRNMNLSDPAILRWQQNEEKKREEFLRSDYPWRIVFSCHMSVCSAPEIRFDEYFKGWGPEDWELSYRLTQHHGYTVEFASHIKAYEVDNLGQGIGNVFRLHTKQAIIDYLRNTFYFFDKCPGQEIEDVFWGLRKLELKNGELTITSKNKDCDLRQRIIQTRNWLAINEYYKPTLK